MPRTAFGSATMNTMVNGTKQEVPRTVSFQTGVKPENAGSLPVNDGKVYVEVSPAEITQPNFTSREEVETAAGKNYDAWVVRAANAQANAKVRASLTAGAKKISVPPTNALEWARTIADGVTAESVFEAAERGAGASVKASAIQAFHERVASGTLTREEILAGLAALIPK